MEITDEMKKKYLEVEGSRCLYCESDDLSYEIREIDDVGGHQEVHCNACNKTWIDCYGLVDVMEIKEG